MKPWQNSFLGFLLGFLATGIIYLISISPKASPLVLIPPPTPGPMIIQVIGEVNAPGVFSLPYQSRTFSAIDMAGGFTINADTEGINLAAKLKDGEKILVPKIGDNGLRKSDLILKNPAEAIPENPVNLNTATLIELESLPQIGPAKAKAIISYRQEQGNFKSIEDLLNVPGIGENILGQIKDLITVD